MSVKCQLTAGHRAPGPVFRRAVSANRGARQVQRTVAPRAPAAKVRESGQKVGGSTGPGEQPEAGTCAARLRAEAHFPVVPYPHNKDLSGGNTDAPRFGEHPHFYFPL